MAIGVHTASSGGIDLVSGFNTLWNNLPNSGPIGIILAAVGALIIVLTVLPWLWQRRKGGASGLGGFPWMAVVIAALLAGPKVVFPVLLGVLGLVINVFIGALNYIIGLF